MEPLQLREHEVFGALKKLAGRSLVIIGGYAVNAYALPRFSVNCDVVVKDVSESSAVERMLYESGYSPKTHANGGDGLFRRYEKGLGNSFVAGFDIFIGQVVDRQSGASIQSEWIFRNSETRRLVGKTIMEALDARIINPDALFVMKMISCRSTDIRDMFMLANTIKDREFVREEVAARCDFDSRFKRLAAVIQSKDFRNGLQGIYGAIDPQTFERSTRAALALGR
jgi:hypothetical protein